MKTFWRPITQIGGDSMWKFLIILNFIVVVLLVEFCYSWTVVERLIFYTYGVFTIVYVFKIPNWKPYFLVLRDRIPALNMKDMVMRIKRRSKN